VGGGTASIDVLGEGLVRVVDLPNRSERLFIRNPEIGEDDFFGDGVAAGNARIVVSARTSDTGANDAGDAFVFDQATGGLLYKIASPEPAEQAEFGTSVLLDGNQVFIGAPSDFRNVTVPGAVYLFDLNGGQHLRTFRSPTQSVGDEFGFSIATMGSRVVIGAFADDTDAADAGIAHMFDVTTGQLLRTFHNPAVDPDDRFGSAVATFGNSVLIAAHRDDLQAQDSGVVYQFDADSGALVRRFPNPTPSADDRAGFRLLVSGRHLLMSSTLDDIYGTDVGAAYVFDIPTGDYIRAIPNPYRTPAVEFGLEMATDDRSYAISSMFESRDAPEAGVVFIFEAVSQATVRVAHTDFLEPPIGSASFTPTAGDEEIGFRSRIVASTGGANPLLAVNTTNDPDAPVLIHRSVNAETTFDPIYLTGWQDVSVSMRLRLDFTGYEAGDFVRAYVTNGADTIYLLNETATDPFDFMDQLSRVGFNFLFADIPADWDQATLVIQSSSNSSTGAERYEFDSIRFHGVAVIPEPTTGSMVILAFVATVACRLGRRVWAGMTLSGWNTAPLRQKAIPNQRDPAPRPSF
jgi:hypothetical protein